MGFLDWLFRKDGTDERDALKVKYEHFRRLLAANNEVLEMITDLEGVLAGSSDMTLEEIQALTRALQDRVRLMVQDLDLIADGRYRSLLHNVEKIAEGIEEQFHQVHGAPITRLCIPLEEITRELADAVGAKTSNLGEARNRVGLPVPPGFGVSTFAYRSFVEGSGIQPRLSDLWQRINWDDWASISEASAEMTQLVLGARMPQEVAEEIALAAHDLNRKAKGRARIAIRSSAIGEDGRSTFAGQYETFLNVPLEQVLRRYKDVVASKFGSRALFYLHTHGFREEEIAMSVGCFLMVDALAAGVAYSVDPTGVALDRMMLSAVWGLGKPVVDGTMTPDLYLVSRRPGRGLLETRVARKERRFVLGEGDEIGLKEEAVPPELQEQPCLTEEQIAKLADYVRALELHYRCPQDVEWAVDRSRRFYILQTRPLHMTEWKRPPALEVSTGAYRVLFEGGEVASPGVGCGPVFHADLDGDLSHFPHGAVLVAHQTSPRFVEVMTRAAAIITDVGSPTGHMASLAREYRVPAIVDGRTASQLPAGAEVTVDATHRRVFEGRVEELLLHAGELEGQLREGPSMALLERVVGRVARLNLTDPSKNSFRAKNCRTYHDVTRFCHEMAISEMFNLNDYRNLSDKGMAYRLESDIPLGIYVIDLGGGLAGGADSRVVRPEQIVSLPMQALWRGMTTPGIRWAGARPIDLKGLVSVWANTMYDAAKGERGLGANSYAILAPSYMNFGSRLGYHFTTLDSVCSDGLHENYILFRFKGGAADIDRRVRRTRFVAEVLTRHRFAVDQKQDLLNAWVKKLPRAEIEEHLTMVGRLIGCARQLDVVLDAETTLERCLEAFMKGDYGFFEFKGEAEEIEKTS
jgi:pyruvate,water dikinase